MQPQGGYGGGQTGGYGGVQAQMGGQMGGGYGGATGSAPPPVDDEDYSNEPPLLEGESCLLVRR